MIFNQQDVRPEHYNGNGTVYDKPYLVIKYLNGKNVFYEFTDTNEALKGCDNNGSYVGSLVCVYHKNELRILHNENLPHNIDPSVRSLIAYCLNK